MNYYYTDGKNQYGPYPIEELRPKINPNTLVWREGMANWMPASNVDELKKLFAPPVNRRNVPQQSSSRDYVLMVLAILGFLASLWVLTVGTYAFSTHSHIDEATPVHVLISLYLVVFTIVTIVKAIMRR